MASDWIKVASYASRGEAEIVKGLLESNGIRVLIKADDAGGMRPEILMGTGADIWIEKSNLEDAKNLLQDIKED